MYSKCTYVTLPKPLPSLTIKQSSETILHPPVREQFNPAAARIFGPFDVVWTGLDQLRPIWFIGRKETRGVPIRTIHPNAWFLAIIGSILPVKSSKSGVLSRNRASSRLERPTLAQSCPKMCFCERFWQLLAIIWH